jgi:hemoglobin
MVKNNRVHVLFAFAMTCLLFTSLANAQAKTEKTLYQRLGGYDAIAAVTDEFLGRLLTDQMFVRFFSGHSSDSKGHLRQLIVEQLCMVTGGPCVYSGRTMKASHGGLGITEVEWNAAVRHLISSLEKFSVPKKEEDEFLALASTLKSDIVEK